MTAFSLKIVLGVGVRRLTIVAGTFGGESMGMSFRTLFQRSRAAAGADAIGEDMAPSPQTLAEYHALADAEAPAAKASAPRMGPFSSIAQTRPVSYGG